MIEHIIISKILDERDFQALNEIRPFLSDDFKRIAEYIQENSNGNIGRVMVTSTFKDFQYVEDVQEDLSLLATQLKEDCVKKRFVRRMSQVPSRYSQDGPIEPFIKSLIKDLREMSEDLTSEDHRPKALSMMVSEYRSRGKNPPHIESHFDSINQICPFSVGDLIVLFGKSGRGKSTIAAREAVSMAQRGKKVLLWSLEMPFFDTASRCASFVTNVPSAQFRSAALTDEAVSDVETALEGLPLVIRGSDNSPNRDLATLEADILEHNIEVVVVDPFYYLDYEKNTSNTSGGDAAATSMRLRRLAASTGTLIIAVTQATETDASEDGVLEAPKRKDVKKTSQLLEDASMLIGVDSDYRQGIGQLSLSKGRHGGEGELIMLDYEPGKGYVEEIALGGEFQ